MDGIRVRRGAPNGHNNRALMAPAINVMRWLRLTQGSAILLLTERVQQWSHALEVALEAALEQADPAPLARSAALAYCGPSLFLLW